MSAANGGTLRYMSWDDFDAHRNEIEAVVQLLTADPKRRKRFRLAAMYERLTGELVAEVFNTTYGAVVSYSTSWHPEADRVPVAVIPPAPIPTQVARRGGEHGVMPLTGAPGQVFTIVSDATKRQVMGDDIIRAILTKDDPGTAAGFLHTSRAVGTGLVVRT